MFLTSHNVGDAPRVFRPVFRLGLLLCLPVLATACEETNDLIVDVGTAVLVVADPDLVSQGTTDAELRIQVAEWTIEEVDLLLEGDPEPHDMKFGDACEFTDTAFSPPVSLCGTPTKPEPCKCSTGIVLGVGDGSPFEASIRMKFTMEMRRGQPKHLIPTEDADGDGIANAADSCPYVINPGQEDVDSNGLGDACSVGSTRDTDGDGFTDGSDNCLWDTNPDQADTGGVSADGIPDAIGDACTEQTATVRDLASGEETIEVVLPTGEITGLDERVAFLIVDFQSRTSIECDWSIGECLLDTSRIEACVTTGDRICF